MYLRDLMASLLRRWYLVIAAVLLTVLGCGYVAYAIGPTYTMSASVVLIPPKDPSGQIPNRYLSLGSTGAAMQVLTRSLNSDPTHEEVIGDARHADYEAVPDATSSAPIMLLAVTAKSPEDSRAVLARALARGPENLASLQQNLNIAATARIDAQTVSEDSTPTFKLKPQLRPAVTCGVLLLAFFAALIAAFDALMSSRRSTRADRVPQTRHAADLPSITPAETTAHQPPRSERRFR